MSKPTRSQLRPTSAWVDLTYSIHEGMTTFPVHWHPVVEITQLGRHGIENRETRKIVLGTHTGTHCDAPRHFVPNGATVENIPLDTLVGPAFLADFSDCRDGEEIGVKALEKVLGKNAHERLVLRFDWDRHWGNMKYYQDHPFISEDAARWLLTRELRLLAMDTPMPDNPKNGRGTPNDSPIHKILLGQGIVLVEYLCNLRELQSPNIELLVLPLKIKEGDGAPVRCIARDL